MNKIDARGLSCPAPVLETKAAVESRHPKHIEVLVDNEPARQNVARFLESKGYQTQMEQDGGLYTVVGTGGGSAPGIKTGETMPGGSGNKNMGMVGADRMGSGGDAVGG